MQCDQDLFDDWPAGQGEDARLQARAERLFLEVKSAEAGAELPGLLNDMTREMRAQFDYFRALREAAEKALADPADEAAAKTSRADAKAASDAMSLIVRTLEKIDQLQRQIAHDRQMEAERQADAGDLEAARAHFLDLIEARAGEQAAILFEGFKRDWLDEQGKTDDTAAPQPPPDADDRGAGEYAVSRA